MAANRPQPSRPPRTHTPKGPPTAPKSSWNPSFPYPVDYNDHFETPLQAYRDIQPMIDWLFSGDSRDDGRDTTAASNRRSTTRMPVLYDPYYCNGKSKVVLESLGYENVVHEKRDFYEDIRTNRVPRHDVLITNPPYSDDHKIRCLEYCCSRLVGSPSSDATRSSATTKVARSVPFYVLVPAYVASKAYYRSCLQKHGLLETSGSDIGGGVVYLVPNRASSGGSSIGKEGGDAYQYEHPEGTGHLISPFASLWICGIGSDRARVVREWWITRNAHGPGKNSPSTACGGDGGCTVTLHCSLDELEEAGVITTERRANPKQRRRKRKQLAGAIEPTTASPAMAEAAADSRQANKKSKYRDEAGTRQRKRF
jgi:hypothetical protein